MIEAEDRGGEKLVVLTMGGRHIGVASPNPATLVARADWSVAISLIGVPVVHVKDEAEARQYLQAIGGLMVGIPAAPANLDAIHDAAFAGDAVNA